MTASRREQAVQLRLAGLSRSQIAEALGLAAGGGEPLRNSAALNLQIEGWFEGLSAYAAGATRFESVSGVV